MATATNGFEANSSFKTNIIFKWYSVLLFIFISASVIVFYATSAYVMYQLQHPPKTLYYATLPTGERRPLTDFDMPNMLPDTIIRFASKAALAAYAFNFVNFDEQIERARPYFTEAGWDSFRSSVQDAIDIVVQNQLFVNSVIAGAPVISNQGPLPGVDYAWRVQIPFLVTFQSANSDEKRNVYVLLTVVKVPTSDNPAGISIDQFIMV